MLQYRVDTDRSMSPMVSTYSEAMSIYVAVKTHMEEMQDIQNRYVELILCTEKEDIKILNRSTPTINVKKDKYLNPYDFGIEHWYTWEETMCTEV